MLSLPLEPLAIILSYLSPEDAASFKAVCRHLHKKAHSYQLDLFWQPYLNRLHAMDASVSVVGPANTAWRSHCFNHSFTKIHARQLFEIEHFKTQIYEGKINLPAEMARRLVRLPLTKTLSALEIRHQFLNEINAFLIAPFSSSDSPSLWLQGCSLTRIPEDEEWLNYFKTLKSINCGGNQLQAFPRWIGECKSLKYLNLDNNQLEYLPESIGNCQKLKWLWIDNNRLKGLPESLGDCANLERIFASENQLLALPDSLGKCRKLDCVYVDKNKLTSLPSSLAYCPLLVGISCEHNFLTDLPVSFRFSQGLTYIHCSHNKITYIPKELAQCATLESISCWHNELEYIDIELKKLMFSCDNKDGIELALQYQNNNYQRQALTFLRNVGRATRAYLPCLDSLSSTLVEAVINQFGDLNLGSPSPCKTRVLRLRN